MIEENEEIYDPILDGINMAMLMEDVQEDYLTSAKIHSRCRVVFWRSFISALFLSFFQLHP